MATPPPTFAPTSETLEKMLSKVRTDTISVRELLTMMGEQGLLMLCAMMTLPFLFPVSIPGVSTVFGAAIVLIGVAITLNKLPWLPSFVGDRKLDWKKLKPVLEKGIGVLRKVDQFLKPHRLAALSHSAMMNRLNGLAVIFAAFLLMLPLGLIPFSNTLPGIAILFLSIGIAQRDGLLVAAGYAMIVLTLIYFSFLAWVAWAGGQSLIG